MATGDVDLPGHTYTSLAFLLTNLRRFGPAREMLERARARAENEHDVAFQLHMATRTAGFAGAWDDVERLGKEALERLERLGHLPAAASVLEYLAEAQRKTGHLEGARKVLERVLEVQEAVGGTTVIARMNLGSVALSLGDFEAAERHLVHGLQEAKAIGRRVLILVALAGLLCTAAGLERPAQVEELTATLRAEFDVGVPAEGDIAEHLERAGRLMASRPELSGNAQGVLMLSMRVYEALGHMEKVDELRALLNELDVFPWDVAMAAEPDKQP
jgi:tetratricopeptide (TPR) repeat protein